MLDPNPHRPHSLRHRWFEVRLAMLATAAAMVCGTGELLHWLRRRP